MTGAPLTDAIVGGLIGAFAFVLGYTTPRPPRQDRRRKR